MAAGGLVKQMAKAAGATDVSTAAVPMISSK